VSGTTFDARSAYFSYESIVATAFAGRTIGNVHTSGIVAVNPAHLVSMRAGRYQRDRYQYWTLSLGDLNE
jgi:ethanolamine ammonia-lyase small subunit